MSLEDEWVYGTAGLLNTALNVLAQTTAPISFELFAFHSLPLLSLLFAPGLVSFYLFRLYPSFKVLCIK